ncbi:hypothetical protein JW859_09535 [bacterium]|nr:hypothetical protein [bacterium]
MEKNSHWAQDLVVTWRTLIDPDNPFIPWLLIFDLVLIVVHLSIVYWVYRDAMQRYNRGAPWAVLAAILPVGGWLFYLLYRNSALVQFDRIEAELFDESEHEWTDYDTYKKDQGSRFFRELGLTKKPEAEGYSPWVRLSRLRELKKIKTPEEKAAIAEAKKQKRLDKRKQRAEARAAAREKQQQRAIDRRERTTMTARHGFQFKLSERGQRRLQRKLELVEKLKKLPREDEALEELIYNMEYQKAQQAAREALAVAEELNDEQGRVTYQAYLERIGRLLESE